MLEWGKASACLKVEVEGASSFGSSQITRARHAQALSTCKLLLLLRKNSIHEVYDVATESRRSNSPDDTTISRVTEGNIWIKGNELSASN